MKFRTLSLSLVAAFAALLALSGCVSAKAPPPAPMSDLAALDFEAAHSQSPEDANKSLIFGNVPVAAPKALLPEGLKAFSGRWEGYSYAPPVIKDYKVVLVIQEINARGGKL
jgi:hypothetical protein